MRRRQSKIVKLISWALEACRVYGIPHYGSKFSRHDFTQHQHIALLVLKTKHKLCYRDVIEIVAEMPKVMAALKLKAAPHFTTLQKFMKKIESNLLNALISYVALALKYKKPPAIVDLAVDASGFSSSYASRYYIERIKEGSWCRHYLKGSLAVDVERQLVVAARLRKSPSNDYIDFIPLLRNILKGGVSIEKVRADKAYDGESNLQYMKKMEIEAVIPIKGGANAPSWRTGKAKARKAMLRRWNKEPGLEKDYHRRNIVETVNSVLKRKFGESLSSRSHWLRRKELLLRLLTYNLYRRISIGSFLLPEGFYRAFQKKSYK